MKFEREPVSGGNLFTGYGEGYVAINGRRLTRGLVVDAERVIENWGPATLDALTPAHIAELLAGTPEVILLGTGSTFRFPHPSVLAPLHAARVGVEVMDTPAACRTFNILAGEGRRVVAALLVDGPPEAR